MRPTELRIDLLGGFQVTVGGTVVPDDTWRRRKPATLLEPLALSPGHRLHHERLTDALWSKEIFGSWKEPEPYIRIVPQPK